jgi:succinyl-CoA:acetate CoA-transferase
MNSIFKEGNTGMIDIRDRVRNTALHAKIVSAEEAAAIIKPGMNIGTSGFTPAGYPKAVPLALAARMKEQPFQVNLWTGASVGKELDGALAEAGGIGRRLPYQTNDAIRKQINAGKINYIDMHLSHVAQMSRYGFLGGKVDVAIVEACAITEEGHIIPTTSLGNTASYVQSADIVIVEVNTSQPLELEGMHDVYVPLDPPNRQPVPIVKADDRIGTPYIPCGVDKITYIVPCDIPDTTRPLAAIDDDARAMSGYVSELFENEVKHGRMPKNLLPLQSGVGSVANVNFPASIKSNIPS